MISPDAGDAGLPYEQYGAPLLVLERWIIQGDVLVGNASR